MKVRERVHMSDFILRASDNASTSPSRFARLSWLCVVASSVALKNGVMRPALSEIMRPTRKMDLILSVWF